MKSNTYPKMSQLKTGNQFKVLEVTGTSGMIMPEHISTKEAVITVQKGSAVLKMKGIDHELNLNTSFLVPAGEKHELKILENFQAIVIMEIDSEVKFTNN